MRQPAVPFRSSLATSGISMTGMAQCVSDLSRSGGKVFSGEHSAAGDRCDFVQLKRPHPRLKPVGISVEHAEGVNLYIGLFQQRHEFGG